MAGHRQKARLSYLEIILNEFWISAVAFSPLKTDTTFVLRGAIYVLASGMFFTLAGVTVRIAGQEVSLESVVFFRNVFALLAFGPWLFVYRREGIKTQVPGLHAVRLIAGLGAMYCYYYALTAIPLAEAVLLNFSGPIFTPLVAFLWFGLRINRGTLIALTIGFFGVALIVRPESLTLNPGMISGIFAGILGAISVVAIWRMGQSESAGRLVFYYSAGSTLVSAIPMAFGGQLPSKTDTWVALIACGGLSAIAHFLLAKGCSIAPADRANALSYGSVFFAALVGWLLWAEQPGVGLFLGAILIAISATLVTRRKI